MEEDYKYIRAWCKWIHPEDDTVDNMFLHAYLEEAEKYNAPEDAVFYDSEKESWVTIDMITNSITKHKLMKIAKSL